VNSNNAKTPTHVYLVSHLLEIAFEHPHTGSFEYEDSKIVGVFRTHAAAKLAVSKLRTKPGFREAKRGFYIERYALGDIEWSEGFVTV
jgi:hypothetical protein